MDKKKIMEEVYSFSDHIPLRLKNLETVLAFMTDDDDAVTGQQKEKRLNRYKLYAKDGIAFRYGAGYVYKGADRLRQRDEVTVARFPVWFTSEMRVYQQADPNLFVVIGKAGGVQVDENGKLLREIPHVDPCLNIFRMEDGLIKEYVEYVIENVQYPHDLADIEVLRQNGQDDQIL